jgi:hypothetical protein
MTRTIATAIPSESADAATNPRRRLTQPIKIIVGLLAVYTPIVLVLALHRMPIAKAYFALSIWATEGILWYWLDNRAHRDHPHRD